MLILVGVFSTTNIIISTSCIQFQQFPFLLFQYSKGNIKASIIPMSSTFFSLLHLFLLLSLAVCSCNARPIGVIKKKNELARSSHFSSKDEENASSFARVLISANTNQPSNQNESEPARTDSYMVEKRLNDHHPKSNQNVEHHELKDDERHKVGGAATVSWRLPHPKAGEREPGFNLDYDPPHTHPGVHN